jgi:hypothetical protein
MKPFTFVLALVLATCQMPLRDSEARPWDALHCGRTDLAHLPAKYFLGETCSAPCDGEEHFFDLKKDPNLERPLPNAVRYGEDDEIYYRGVKCRGIRADQGLAFGRSSNGKDTAVTDEARRLGCCGGIAPL